MSAEQIKKLLESIDANMLEAPKKPVKKVNTGRTLYGIAAYYGGGFQSFGEELVISVLHNGPITVAELTDSADDGSESENDSFGTYAEDLVKLLKRGKNPAVVHEVSDSWYAVGTNKMATIRAFVNEFNFGDRKNKVDFLNSLMKGETGEFEYQDPDSSEEDPNQPFSGSGGDGWL